MTDNQFNLLKFIAHYRAKYLSSPTMREMVEAIGVFDNRSLLGILATLERGGFLVRSSQRKARSVQLTAKGEALIGIYPSRMRSDLERLASLFGTSSVGTSHVPTHGTIGSTGAEIPTDSTDPAPTQDMLYAASLLLGKDLNSSSPMGAMGWLQSLSHNLRSSRSIYTVTSILTLSAVVLLVGKGFLAMAWYALTFASTVFVLRTITTQH